MAHYLPPLNKEVIFSDFFVYLIKEYCLSIDPKFNRNIYRSEVDSSTWEPNIGYATLVYIDESSLIMTSPKALWINPFVFDEVHRTDEFIEKFKNIEGDIIKLKRDLIISNLIEFL